MINTIRKKINSRQRIMSQGLYKALIAISLGLLGFVGTFFTLRFNVNQLSLDFVWSMMLPMLVNQAWGTKYGLISFYIGLGAFHSFYHWKNSGWAVAVNFLVNFIWFISHGYGLKKRKQSEKYLYSVYFIEIICLLIDALLYFFLFPFLVKYNPPFWCKDAITVSKIGTLYIVFVKRIIQDFFILAGCDVLFLIPSVKKIFLFKIENKSRHNGVILVIALGVCTLFWLLSVFIEYLLSLKDNPRIVSRGIDARDIIFLIILMMFCMVTGSITIRYLEKKRKAEELVRLSQRKYDDIFENIMNLYCETLIDGTVIEISPSVKKTLGYDPEEIIGKNIGRIYKKSKFREQVIQRLQKEKCIENLEFEGIKRDGTECILLVNFKLVNTEDGIIKIISIAKDVTDYVEAKRKQTEVQEEYKRIFHKMINGMIISEFIYDENNEPIDMLVIKANPAIEKHVGVKAADAIGKTYINSFGGSKLNLKKLQNILKTDISLQNEVFTNKLNRYLMVNAFKINGSQIGIMFQDISELKKLETKYKEMAANLEAIFESTDDMIYSVDRNYRILNFNSSLKDYMKRSYGVEIENGRSILEFLPDEVAQIWKSYYDNAMSSERHSFEYYIKHQKRYCEVFLNPIYHNGEICGVAVFTKDISKRKEAEQQLMKINRDLEQLVEERTSELRNTLTELEAFTYTVSHDLKSPLRAIDGYSGIILEDYKETLEEEVVKMLTNISDVSYDAINLIDTVLQYSTTSKANILIEKVDIEEMFERAFDEFKTTCTERTIEFSIEDPLPIVIADKILIRQVVYNILSNAIKFTKNNEIAIISVGYTKNCNEHIFFIEDNGAGFDMKYSSKLFSMFQRLHNKDEYEGSGIGLATVHKIIQKHGGRTWIESELNKGTKIYFTLPME